MKSERAEKRLQPVRFMLPVGPEAAKGCQVWFHSHMVTTFASQKRELLVLPQFERLSPLNSVPGGSAKGTSTRVVCHGGPEKKSRRRAPQPGTHNKRFFVRRAPIVVYRRNGLRI